MRPPTVGNDRELVEGSRLLSLLHGHGGHVAIAEIVLCQFLEFTKAYYGVDMTQGSGQTVNDFYEKDVVERYTKIAESYNAFKTRHTSPVEVNWHEELNRIKASKIQNPVAGEQSGLAQSNKEFGTLKLPINTNTTNNISTKQPKTAHTIDSVPAGKSLWMAIPTGRPRGQQEVPLWMYDIAKDVIEDPSYAQLSIEVIRQEILERLSERSDWPSKLHLISLQFVTNLRSSLTHRNFFRRPRQCYRVDDHTSSSEIEELDDSASAVSMTSFHSPPETTTSNEPGAAAGSSPHAVHIPTFVTSPGSEGETRHFEFLHVFCQFLEVQLEHLKLLSESRKHQKARNKAPKKVGKMLKKGRKSPKKYRTRLREGIERTDARNDNEPKLQPANTVLKTRQGQAHKPDDDLDSLFGSDGEEEHENYAPEDS